MAGLLESLKRSSSNSAHTTARKTTPSAIHKKLGPPGFSTLGNGESAEMNDLTHLRPVPSTTYRRSSQEIEALATEIAKCLQLVVPASMTQDDRKAWILAAVDALEDIRPLEITAISAELRRTVTRPAQIVPEIARLVAIKRQNKAAAESPPSQHFIELQMDLEYRDRLAKARSADERERIWADHRRARADAGFHVPPIEKPLSREELDRMRPDVRNLGISAGFLEYRNGQLCETPR